MRNKEKKYVPSPSNVRKRRNIHIMPKSYENQKSICIHKPRVTTNFLQIANAEWMQANKTLTPYGLQLYLYLASNTDQYQFALSPAAAEEYAGIKSTTFHKYLRLLEIEGYLVWRKGSLYDFYTTPREPKQRTHPDQHCECIYFEDTPSATRDEVDSSPCEASETAARSIVSPDEFSISFDEPVTSHSDKEIDNRDIERDTDKKIDNIDAGTPRPPMASDAFASYAAPIERVIRIPVPTSKPIRRRVR